MAYLSRTYLCFARWGLVLGFCLALTGILAVQASLAQQLDVPVTESPQDDLDTCALGQVFGLKTDGDGFLAVRTGPGSKYRKIDELHNGDQVWMFDTRGKWVGIVYGAGEVSCSPVKVKRTVPHRGKKGWVHRNWVRVIAG